MIVLNFWDGRTVVRIATPLLPELEDIVIAYVGNPLHDQLIEELHFFHSMRQFDRCMESMRRLWSDTFY